MITGSALQQTACGSRVLLRCPDLGWAPNHPLLHPWGSGTQQPRSHAHCLPHPQQGSGGAGCRGLQALGSPGAGGSLCYPSPPEECRKGFPATPGPVWATVLGTLAAAAAHPSWESGARTPRQGPLRGRQEWDASPPGGRVHRNENPSRAAGLDPGAQLSSWWGESQRAAPKVEGPVCARSSGPNARTTASMTGPCDPFHERKRNQHPVSPYCGHRLS